MKFFLSICAVLLVAIAIFSQWNELSALYHKAVSGTPIQTVLGTITLPKSACARELEVLSQQKASIEDLQAKLPGMRVDLESHKATAAYRRKVGEYNTYVAGINALINDFNIKASKLTDLKSCTKI